MSGRLRRLVPLVILATAGAGVVGYLMPGEASPPAGGPADGGHAHARATSSPAGHHGPASLASLFRSGAAFVELDDVAPGGTSGSPTATGTVRTVHYSEVPATEIAVGARVSFFRHKGVTADGLRGWVLLARTGLPPDAGPRFVAIAAIRDRGAAIEPASYGPQYRDLLHRGGSQTGRSLAALLRAVEEDPNAAPSLLVPSRDPVAEWLAQPPARRVLDAQLTPPEILREHTVRALLRLDIPADVAASAAAHRGETWLLQVREPGLGIVYTTELAVGAHDFAVQLPPGELEVLLFVESEEPPPPWRLGTLSSPVESTGGEPRMTGARETTVRVRWRTTPTPASQWRSANPFRATG